MSAPGPVNGERRTPTRIGPFIIAVSAAAASFGAGGLALALFGLGLPFVLADLLAAGSVGVVMLVLARRLVVPPSDAGDERLHRAELQSANLRHELRGALSPALIVSDRLVGHPDPAIRRAGEAIVRSIGRAVALLVNDRRPTPRAGDPAPDLPLPSSEDL